MPDSGAALSHLVNATVVWGGGTGLTAGGLRAQLSAPSKQWLEETGCLCGWRGTHLSLGRCTDARGPFWARSANGTKSCASWVRASSHGGFVNFRQFKTK